MSYDDLRNGTNHRSNKLKPGEKKGRSHIPSQITQRISNKVIFHPEWKLMEEQLNV